MLALGRLLWQLKSTIENCETLQQQGQWFLTNNQKHQKAPMQLFVSLGGLVKVYYPQHGSVGQAQSDLAVP